MSEILESATAKVYLNPSNVPPHPGESWTRFVCISDTHGRRFPVPAGDVLIHAGDLSHNGVADGTVKWIKTLEHRVKIIIAGNHDIYLDGKLSDQGYFQRKHVNQARSLFLSKAAKDAGIHYLEYESFQFTTPSGKQWKVYGSPGSPRYGMGGFQYSGDTEAFGIYEHIPPDTEILITHTPPHRTLDRTKRGLHAGCRVLAAKLNQLSSCRLHVFGHIHEARGACIIEGDQANERVMANAALYSGKPAITIDLRN